VPVVTGFETEQNVVYADNGKLFILTNKNAANSKLVVTDAITPTPEHWKDLIPETKFPLTVSTCGGKLFAQYIKDAVSEIIQYDLKGEKEHVIDLPGPGTAGGFNGKLEEKDTYFTSLLISIRQLFLNMILKEATVLCIKTGNTI
jgi:prolyl oligopeptidase